ncbi:uncharacterized protein LOC132701832 isoform X2 [Cylas formicarius]|uniref:uncharacterized protein LOC132701832 isoform X2 n=1 Tax=Cylas formicarius TaxID=197179 RepID=UPI002958D295|nr:uncharacterized protein LOC132701832 isoform X2 [Cylas formicarius]
MAAFSDIEQQKSFTYLREVETLGQDILTLKEQKIEVANAQNKFREALRALEGAEDRNSWIQLGSVYVQRTTAECKNILRREVGKAEDDLRNLHQEIKDKVHNLRDLEHEPRLEGFTLKPLSLAEAKALHKETN